jgi:TolA-binding protein
MNEALYLTFENYLSNEISAEEKIHFELQLQNDADIKEKFEIYKENVKFLETKFSKESEAFQKNVKKIVTNSEVDATPKKGKVFQMRNIFYAVAAVFLVFFSITLFSESNPEYSDYSNHEKAYFTERGDIIKSLKTAQDAFNNKKYKEAIKNFEVVIKEYPRPEVKYFYAIALIEDARYNDADVVLNDIIKGNSVYKNTATWYLALSKLKQKEYAACKSILLMIPNDYEDYTQVEKLLKELK